MNFVEELKRLSVEAFPATGVAARFNPSTLHRCNPLKQ